MLFPLNCIVLVGKEVEVKGTSIIRVLLSSKYIEKSTAL